MQYAKTNWGTIQLDADTYPDAPQFQGILSLADLAYISSRFTAHIHKYGKDYYANEQAEAAPELVECLEKILEITEGYFWQIEISMSCLLVSSDTNDVLCEIQYVLHNDSHCLTLDIYSEYYKPIFRVAKAYAPQYTVLASLFNDNTLEADIYSFCKKT